MDLKQNRTSISHSIVFLKRRDEAFVLEKKLTVGQKMLLVLLMACACIFYRYSEMVFGVLFSLSLCAHTYTHTHNNQIAFLKRRDEAFVLEKKLTVGQKMFFC